MRKFLGWLVCPFHTISFLMILVKFHILQVIAFRWFGYQAHKRVADGMIWALLMNLRFWTGSRIRFDPIPTEIPEGKPLILVSNHQSMFDIPLIGWVFSKYHPKYISKKELAKGIPSISYNIRNGGSIAIDRKNPSEAVQLIRQFGAYLEKNGFAGCIFPEGTRSRNGQLLPFKTTGSVELMKAAPNALIIPVAISGSWEIMRYRYLPVPVGIKIRVTPLPAINRQNKTEEEIIRLCEQEIRKALGQDSSADGEKP